MVEKFIEIARMIAIFVFICALISLGFTQLIPKLAYWGQPEIAQPRIVGGFPIDIEDAPYQISLQAYGNHFCGGSIIAPNWILTAGHCTDPLPTTEGISVRLGSSLKNMGGEVIPVEKIITHELYNETTVDYDFSLLKLKFPIRLNATKLKIRLPELDEPVEDGTFGMVSGWGRTQSEVESNSNLRGALLPIVNKLECQKNFAAEATITDRMICAGYKAGGKDACQGDSGGPFVADFKLIGVVSWGFGCAQPNYPGVFSRVATVRDWIRSKTNI